MTTCAHNEIVRHYVHLATFQCIGGVTLQGRVELGIHLTALCYRESIMGIIDAGYTFNVMTYTIRRSRW